MPIPSTQQKPYPHLRQTTPPIPFLLPTPVPAPALSPTYISRPRRHLPRHRFSSRLARLLSPTILLDTHLRRTLSTLIPNTYSQHTSSTRNTHISSIHISGTYIQTSFRTRKIRPSHNLPAYTQSNIGNTAVSETHGNSYTPYIPYTSYSRSRHYKKGGEFSFASPIVLPQRYSLYVNVQKLMLYAALLM